MITKHWRHKSYLIKRTELFGEVPMTRLWKAYYKRRVEIFREYETAIVFPEQVLDIDQAQMYNIFWANEYDSINKKWGIKLSKYTSKPELFGFKTIFVGDYSRRRYIQLKGLDDILRAEHQSGTIFKRFASFGYTTFRHPSNANELISFTDEQEADNFLNSPVAQKLKRDDTHFANFHIRFKNMTQYY